MKGEIGGKYASTVQGGVYKDRREQLQTEQNPNNTSYQYRNLSMEGNIDRREH